MKLYGFVRYESVLVGPGLPSGVRDSRERFGLSGQEASGRETGSIKQGTIFQLNVRGVLLNDLHLVTAFMIAVDCMMIVRMRI